MREHPSSKPVAIWILIGVFMLVIQVLLGGITRLTGSGLSITQWDVVAGVLPPMNAGQWADAFHKYQQTNQYRLLNYDFTLDNFKFIFFWEWFHRLWARTIFVVFLIPFVVFLVQRRIRREMVLPLVTLVLMGGLQGLVGWIMVASGFTGDAVYVNPVNLATHFLMAMVLIGYAFWYALALLVGRTERMVHPGIRRLALGIVICLSVQLMYGAFMAGNKAAAAAPTWPDINGSWVPAGLFRETPWGLNLVDNKITIHFIHRGLGYIVWVLVLAWTIGIARVRGKGPLLRRTYWIPFGLVSLQVLLGITAVLESIHIRAGHWGGFEWVAQFHQLVAMFLFLSLIYVLYMVRRQGLRAV